MWKRGEIAPKEQFLLFSTLFYIYISNFRSQIIYSFVKCGCSVYCFPHSGWLGEAKVLCILHHWGIQLILTCSWARPAILAAGKGRGGMFLFLLFLHCHSFSFLLYPSLSSPLLSLFSLSLGDDTKWPTRVDVSLNPNTINPHSLNSDMSRYGYLEVFQWVPWNLR